MKNFITYFLCAVLLAFCGCNSNDAVDNLEHKNGLPVISTAVVTEFTETTATLSGSISSEGNSTVTEWGICMGSEAAPTERIAATGSKESFSVQVSGLEGGRLYYYRAYAISSSGTITYGEEKVFTTTPVAPIVRTVSAAPAYVDIEVEGEVVFNGGMDITEMGFCYSTIPDPTIESGTVVELNGNTYKTTIETLLPNTDYYVRFYAANVIGISYGEAIKVTTGDYPVVSMPFSEDFSGGTVPPKYWTMLDHDGDGYNWYYYDFSDGTTMAGSRSYQSGVGPLTPYNFLITPKILVEGENPVVQWKVQAHDDEDYEDHYKLVVSEVPITNDNCENASIVKTLFEETLTYAEYEDWGIRRISIEEYVGKEVFISWVHYSCTDQSRMYITDVSIIDSPPILSETFADGATIFPPKGWSLLDHDGDGNSWEFYEYSNGTTTATSHSYKDPDALTPYNFLITPLIAIAGSQPTLKWVVEANSSTYYQEHYKVVVSEEPITESNCENSSIVKTVYEETLPAAAGDDGILRSVDLSAYKGKNVYIAWVHYDCTDISRMYLYDIVITEQP